MRSALSFTLASLVLLGSAPAFAEPEPEPEPVPVEPAPPDAPGPDAPAPEAPPVPPTVPPITINITNTNTNDNHQTNQQDNQQDNQQTSQQDTQHGVTPPPVTVPPSPPALPPLPAVYERQQLSRAARPPSTRWISLAATGELSGHGRPGLRASIDLLGRRGFTLGIAGVLDGAERGRDIRDPAGAAVAYVAWTGRLWGLDLRAQAGIGAALGDAEPALGNIARTADGTSRTDHASRVTPRGEAALLVGLPLGKHLGAIAGPVVSTSKLDGAVETSMLGGLRYRF